ncbi:MAG: peptidylprolyl isomerase [Sciscionella sp.]
MANSIDGSTRSKGGDLGEVAEEQLQPDYAKVAFAAGNGEIFGLVKNNYGWNIGRVSASTGQERQLRPPAARVAAG